MTVAEENPDYVTVHAYSSPVDKWHTVIMRYQQHEQGYLPMNGTWHSLKSAAIIDAQDIAKELKIEYRR